MHAADREPSPVIEWSSAGRALEALSGDLAVVSPFPNGVLVAVIDGLGHGPDAAEAAEAAAQILEADAGSSVLELVQRCHAGLRKLRGAVMSLASFHVEDSSVTWVGVGNVEGELLRAAGSPLRTSEALLTRGGVVGHQIPPLRAATHAVAAGDLLILASDGIRSGFSAAVVMSHSPHDIAGAIFASHARTTDDALVLVARYQGAAP